MAGPGTRGGTFAAPTPTRGTPPRGATCPRQCPRHCRGATYDNQQHVWTFPAGTTLSFRHMQHESDMFNYQGGQYQFLGFDELTQFTERPYRFLFRSLRRGKTLAVPLRMRGASNPGNIGHEWVFRRFIAPGALEKAGVSVRFAIHPVAGRMPGHMNVLLAEAGVPYEKIFDLEEINADFPSVDVALVIGANDVVNPVARTDKSSPIYGMPILDVDRAHNVIVIKRGQGAGYSGIENALFFAENCRMCYGSAQGVVAEIIAQIKVLEG